MCSTFRIVPAVLALLLPVTISGQSPGPSFEVASIRRQLPPIARISFQLERDQLLVEAMPVKYLLMRAFGVASGDILGGPAWADSDRYTIEAKADGIIPPDEFPRMLRSLLEDRFQLKAHQETRELPVYELLVARGGPKLKVSEDQTPAVPPPVTGERLPGNAAIPRGAFGSGSGSVGARAVALSHLTDFLRSRLGRPVIDKTGLTGLFDIRLQWAPGSEQVPVMLAPDPDVPAPLGPSIFTALQEQLGLKLESSKGPVEVLVIDSVQKPSEN